MLRRIKLRLTYANVVATLALFIALGGGAYAAIKLPANSVGTKQLKNKAVTPKKLSRGAIRLLRGHRGVKGDKGDPGTPGANFSPDATLPSGATLRGSWGVGGGIGDWLGDDVQFRIPLAAPPSHSYYLAEGDPKTASCPADGQAAPDTLCVYADEGSGNPTFSAIYFDEAGTGGSNAGAGRNGFLIYFSGTAANSYLSGSWAVTAP